MHVKEHASKAKERASLRTVVISKRRLIVADRGSSESRVPGIFCSRLARGVAATGNVPRTIRKQWVPMRSVND